MNRITPELITELAPGEIFVFGSNTQGRHGKGAAKLALEKFGAIYRRSWGLQGRSFAIPTKRPVSPGSRLLVPLELDDIGACITMFLGFAMADQGHRYLVTRIGCGEAGYTPAQIAPLFFRSDYVTKPEQIPANISLPADFWQAMNHSPK